MTPTCLFLNRAFVYWLYIANLVWYGMTEHVTNRNMWKSIRYVWYILGKITKISSRHHNLSVRLINKTNTVLCILQFFICVTIARCWLLYPIWTLALSQWLTIPKTNLKTLNRTQESAWKNLYISYSFSYITLLTPSWL